MSDPNATPGAGWYPDPEEDAGERWWNGVSWSDRRRALAIPVPPVAPPPAVRPNPYGGATLPPYTGPASPGYVPPPTTANQNTLALAGMIVALCGVFVNFILFGLAGFVGGILSIVGLVRANTLAASGVTVGNGRGFAITGIVIGFGGALLWNVFFFATLTLPSSSPYGP